MAQLLVSTEWLAHHLQDSNVRVVDVRWYLFEKDKTGKSEYLNEHIPGAVLVDMDTDLTSQDRGGPGRHPMPYPHVFAEAMSRLGIDANTHVHVSFDVDFLDPAIAPGVGTTVPGGPNYREAQLVMEMIADAGSLGSIDIVELNPAFDEHNKTAILAVDLIESLFGKSTLMRDVA